MKDCKDIDIVCFDIFDTIVARLCSPDYTKKAWAHYMSSILGQNSISLFKIRMEAEKYLYEQSYLSTKEKEFTYDELLRVMHKTIKTNLPFEEFSRLSYDVETSIEKSVQHVRPDTLAIVETLKKQNKTLICISDMYLPKKAIMDIFCHLGIEKYFDDIIVSGDIMKSKKTGTVYEYVKSKYGKEKKYLMIGDNYDSDYKNATEHGFTALHFDDAKRKAFYASQEKNQLNPSLILRNLKCFVETNDLQACQNEYAMYRFLFDAQRYLFCNKRMYTFDSSEQTAMIKDRAKFFFNNSWIKLDTKNKTAQIVYSNDRLTLIDDGETIIEARLKNQEIDIDIFKYYLQNIQNKLIEKRKIERIIYHPKPLKPAHRRGKESLIACGSKYAPIFYEFIAWILKDCKEKGIKSVYFFTREGEFFEKIAKKIDTDREFDLQVLEVSRMSTFCPSIQSVSLDEFMRVWSQYSTQSISAMFKSINIDPVPVIDVIEKYNIPLNEDIINPWEDPRIVCLFKDKEFEAYLSEEIQEKRKNIKQYFISKGLTNTNKKFAIVDIGWRGTIQDNICKILNNSFLEGYYFGLEPFLNAQPANSHKQGFINLFRNYPSIIKNVTPLEMMCNSPNGSTIGYTNDATPTAIRKIDTRENESYYSCVQYLQKGVIKEISSCKKGKKISDDKLYYLIIDAICNPNRKLAKTYFDLKHNEEFGFGGYVFKKHQFNYLWIPLSIFPKYRSRLISTILDSSWPQGFAKAHYMDFICQYKKQRMLTEVVRGKISIHGKRIAWYIPSPIKGSGGHRTIIQNANNLVRAGYDCDLIVENDGRSTAQQMSEMLKDYFGEKCLCGVHMGSGTDEQYDMAIATYNIGTAWNVKNSNARHKAYFIQDYEAWFAPMGEGYIYAEETYEYGLQGLCIGYWLAKKQLEAHDVRALPFPFCADLNIYKKIKVEKENAVCFICQPEKPRRCSQLGIRALQIVKDLRPNTKIYLYGNSNNIITPFECQNLQILTPSECNELYNRCRVGFCLSSSNPSRIPFEMMASGLPVVDMYRENNLYDMPDGAVMLAKSTPEALAAAIIKILDDKELSQQMSEYGQNYMKAFPLERGFQIFTSGIETIIEDRPIVLEKIKRLYNKPIFLATKETQEAAKKFSLFIEPGYSKKLIIASQLKSDIKRIIRGQNGNWKKNN